MIPYKWTKEEKEQRRIKSKRPWWRRYKERFEEELEIKLEEGEEIHHIDYNKHHGCVANLMCLFKEDHKKLHVKRRILLIETCKGKACEKGQNA